MTITSMEVRNDKGIYTKYFSDREELGKKNIKTKSAGNNKKGSRKHILVKKLSGNNN